MAANYTGSFVDWPPVVAFKERPEAQKVETFNTATAGQQEAPEKKQSDFKAFTAPRGSTGQAFGTVTPFVCLPDKAGTGVMMSIAGMDIYQDKSFEELRMEDYRGGRRGPKAFSSLSILVGSPEPTPLPTPANIDAPLKKQLYHEILSKTAKKERGEVRAKLGAMVEATKAEALEGREGEKKELDRLNTRISRVEKEMLVLRSLVMTTMHRATETEDRLEMKIAVREATGFLDALDAAEPGASLYVGDLEWKKVRGRQSISLELESASIMVSEQDEEGEGEEEGNEVEEGAEEGPGEAMVIGGAALPPAPEFNGNPNGLLMRSAEMWLQRGECNSVRDRLHKMETPRLLFLFAPALTAVSTSPVVRSALSASVSESDQHEKAVSPSNFLQPLLDPSFSSSSTGKKNEKQGKLTQTVVRGPARAREKGTTQEVGGEEKQDKEPLKPSWRREGEEVLVEIPAIEGLSVGGEGDGKMETAKLWKCNECGGLFKTLRGLHVHVARMHRR
uniref:C2H2-type domain-containing protein n=1 Tax=Chromera velia CCMP2878 TaxID=1169474 RepID=A0A0G4HDU6_9ALVE|eukprot:Cvel_6478.t1-p1 / transcript=Cvel_6478.t1 / gene=Cvel_6478 / organism=Chromera_velia_CCMP2878 / gene_product=hypothetical protein / transcript_product=hypothetical protein / location=Cvel_scaffold318:3647-10055(+) / protein_length=504 / sequence_SO=supercontig / SO=protein_coding / is_pseudo=false